MTEYPEMITSLPEAEIPFQGLQGWILQGGLQQLVFLEIEPIGKVTEHTPSAPFGIVLDGEMTLTIGGVTKTYRKGDTYMIPEGVPLSAVFHSKVFVVDLFDEPARYRAKRGSSSEAGGRASFLLTIPDTFALMSPHQEPPDFSGAATWFGDTKVLTRGRGAAGMCGSRASETKVSRSGLPPLCSTPDA